MAFNVPGLEGAERIPKRIGLIDADCVAYWAAAGCDDMTKHAAIMKVQDRMTSIKDQIQTDDIRCFLTGPNNFRNKIGRVKQYKGNRYDKYGNRIKPQPKWLQACRKYILNTYRTVLCDGQEADDALAIAQIKCNASQDWHSIISSIDKDLRICPGLHHDMNSGYIMTADRLGKLEIDPKGKVRGWGLKFFYAQMLMGDSADHIPGLPKVNDDIKAEFGLARKGGCGPKAAYNILDGADDEMEMYRRVYTAYSLYWDGTNCYQDWETDEVVYPTAMDQILEQGRLLWMRHNEGEMWEPHPELLDGTLGVVPEEVTDGRLN